MGDGENYARVRVEQQKALREQARGQGNARNLAPGYLFDFALYPRADQNKRYLIESASYNFEENVRRSDGAGGSGNKAREGTDSPTRYRLGVTVVPSSVAWRSQRNTPRPRTTGPQTAVVTGPAGEEIYCDQYGRVKVQFHWDRYGTFDENSSCWIRVSSSWAGANYGEIYTPRIGQEVVVDHLNGDPDHPLITGRVYNAMQMPPWELPANKTQSGVLSRSSKGGVPGDGMKNSPGTANAIRFEDKKDAEQLWLHAQKDQLTEVENDEDKWVGQDRRKTIDRDEFNTVHRDRTEIVDRNEKINVHGWRTEEVDLDETITIHGKRTEVVDGDEDITIHSNRKERVDHNESISIGDNRTEDVGGDETIDITGTRSVTIGGAKSETVTLAKAETIGLAKVLTIGLGYQTTVGAIMNTTVALSQTAQIGLTKSTIVGQDFALRVGGGAGAATPAPADGMPMNIVAPSGGGGGGGSGDGEGSSITMDADTITLRVGKSVLVMTADGQVTINGNEIDLVADKHMGLESERIDIN